MNKYLVAGRDDFGTLYEEVVNGDFFIFDTAKGTVEVSRIDEDGEEVFSGQFTGVTFVRELTESVQYV